MSTLADICLLFKTRATGKALLLGKFLDAMYFGTLIANSSQAHLPDLRLPLIGRIPGERIVQAGVLAVAAAWLYTGLVPGSILAAAAAVAAAMGMAVYPARRRLPGGRHAVPARPQEHARPAGRRPQEAALTM